MEARDERSFLRLKGQLAKLDLLVLGELGYVPASKIGAELLFDVISTGSALHTAAIVQVCRGGPGRDHYDRKIAELKTPKEAQRSLKRQLSNVVYRRLLEDHARRQNHIVA